MKNLFLVGILLSSSVFAEDTMPLKESLGLNGNLRLSYFSDDKNYNSENNFFPTTLLLKSKPKEVLEIKSYFEMMLQNEDKTTFDLREGYLEKSLGNFDFRIGRQIIVWGRADKVNPIDNFKVQNMKKLLVDDEEQKLGAMSSNISYHLGSFKINLVNVYEWREPTFPIKNDPSINLLHKKPNDSNKQFGLKLDKTDGEIDWSISYFNGINKTPDLELKSFANNVLSLILNYQKIQTYGFDFSTSRGEYGYRGEFAYNVTGDQNGNDPYTQNRNFFGVLGIEKNLIENLNLNFQYMYKHVDNFKEPNSYSNALDQNIAKNVNLNSNQMRKDMHGLTIRPQYKLFNDTLEIEVAGVFWFITNDSVVKPKITYSVSDSLKTILGAEIYNGKNESFFGRLKDGNNFFTEIRYEF